MCCCCILKINIILQKTILGVEPTRTERLKRAWGEGGQEINFHYWRCSWPSLILPTCIAYKEIVEMISWMKYNSTLLFADHYLFFNFPLTKIYISLSFIVNQCWTVREWLFFINEKTFLKFKPERSTLTVFTAKRHEMLSTPCNVRSQISKVFSIREFMDMKLGVLKTISSLHSSLFFIYALILNNILFTYSI